MDILQKKQKLKSQQQQKVTSIDPSLQQAIDSLVKSGPNLLSSLVSNMPAAGSSSAISGGGGGGGGAASAGGSQLSRFYANMQNEGRRGSDWG